MSVDISAGANRVVTGLGNENLTITDFSLDAAILDDITVATTTANGSAAKSSGNINVISSQINVVMLT